MMKRLAAIMSGIVAFLGLVVAYDQLTDGAVRTFLASQGLPVLVVLLLYFAVPIGFYILAVMTPNLYYTLRLHARSILKQRGRWTIRTSVSSDDILSFINKAEVRGVLEKDEARILIRLVRDMEPIEFDILELCDNPTKWAESFGVAYPKWKTGKRIQVLDFAIPLLRGEKANYDLYLDKLHDKQLLSLGRDALYRIVSGDELLQPVTTPTGHRLAYIVKRVRMQ